MSLTISTRPSNFTRGKRVFSAISDEVLRDYVEAGHAVSEGGGCACVTPARGRPVSIGQFLG
ncbi:MAG: hypothetical protein CM15mP74_08140 [Halieaceae bacterium]|nr:MAG: hypothetical protein CM15mP74_08140 [Halieaceae bacterium]